MICETHVVIPTKEKSVTRQMVYRWKCDKCDFLKVVILDDEHDSSEITVMSEGDLLVRHVMKKYKVSENG